MNDDHLFRAARECSFKSDYTGGNKTQIGCVVVYKNTILAKGWNSDKTHTDQAKFNVVRFKDSGNRYLPNKIHAEIAALSKIKYLDIDFSKVHVYTYRELKDGSIALAKPCSACMQAIRSLGIRNIHYTTADGYAFEKLMEKKK